MSLCVNFIQAHDYSTKKQNCSNSSNCSNILSQERWLTVGRPYCSGLNQLFANIATTLQTCDI